MKQQQPWWCWWLDLTWRKAETKSGWKAHIFSLSLQVRQNVEEELEEDKTKHKSNKSSNNNNNTHDNVDEDHDEDD